MKGEVFGSYYLVKYRGELKQEDFQKELDQFFKEFNQEFSTYDPKSVISSLNSSEQNKKLKVSERFIEMLKMAKKFHEDTAGAFDPTLGPLIRVWGFGGGKEKRTPSTTEIENAQKRVGFKHLHWDEKEQLVWKTNDLMLDVNAFAPGWAADLIGLMLESHGVMNYMIDISGEILFKGMKTDGQSWIAGIETPGKEWGKQVQLAFKIEDLAIATSGNYRQYFTENGEIRGHILDPRTAAPVKHQISSASVLASNTAEADAWSTAMMILGQEGLDLAEKRGIKVMLLEAKKPQEFVEIMSPGMRAYLEANRL